MAKTCWYRYDDDVPDQRTAAMASSDADPNWYMNSGATCRSGLRHFPRNYYKSSPRRFIDWRD
jgi:hypothetical protein